MTSMVKSRSASGQTPTNEQIKTCLPFLIAQIEAISPKIICTMGPIISLTLLKTNQPLIRLRGNFHSFQSIPLMPTFHPSYLLKHQEMKKATWIDLKMIQRRLAG